MMNVSRWIFSGVLALLLAGCFQGVKSRTETSVFDINTVTFDEHTYPAVVIGGGIAGLTAANYLAQAEIPCIVIEGEKPGGALAQSDSVRNWPGVFNLAGAKITQTLKQQVLDNGVAIAEEKVTAFHENTWPYTLEVQHVSTGATKTMKALTVVIATGAEPNYLNVPGERGDDGYWGRKVTNCAVCDGSLSRGKEVAVVGGGDSAIVEASYLSGIAKQVTIFVRKDTFKTRDKRRMSETLARPNVSVVFNTEIKRISGDGKQMTHLEIFNNQTQETKTIPMDGLFLATGSRPNTMLFKNKIELDGDGYIVLKEGQSTSLVGVYAAGDVHDRKDRQAVTSAAAGCKAALEIKNFLDKRGFDAKTMKNQQVSKKDLLTQSTEKSQKKEIISKEKELNLVEISSREHFENILKAQGSSPIIIDFYATWCGPCRQMEPIIHALAQKFPNILFMKINIDQINPNEISTQLGGTTPIMGIPTFLFVQQGKQRALITGGRNQISFEEEVKRIFNL